MQELRYDGRVAIVTGGGRGLGRAYAELLASRGAKVLVNDTGASIVGSEITGNPADEVVAAITAAGGEAIACTESVATEAGGNAIIAQAMDAWGRVDILIHNAGNVRYGSLTDMSYDDFKAVTDVHLMGAYHVVRPAFPIMKQQQYGRVVLTGSIGGIYGHAGGVANYSVSKSAMIGLSNVIANEGLDDNIKSNVILPGAVTRMSEGVDTTNFPEMGPDLVAPVVAYLCHESCEVSAEMMISVAGRVARAFINETEGCVRKTWQIEDVAENLDAIRNADKQWTLHPAEGAFMRHLTDSFALVAEKG